MVDIVRGALLAFARLHVLHHASEEPIFGVGMMRELRRHGYAMGPGTLYPLLHRLETDGLLVAHARVVEGKARKYYVITPRGRKVLATIAPKIAELADEVLPESHARPRGPPIPAPRKDVAHARQRPATHVVATWSCPGLPRLTPCGNAASHRANASTGSHGHRDCLVLAGTHGRAPRPRPDPKNPHDPDFAHVLPLVLLTLAVAAPAQPVKQTPITVEVVNDSGLSDAQVYLLVTGQDLGNTPAGQPGTYYPFSVSNVAVSPSGLVVGATGALSTANGANNPAAAMPLFVAASASPVAMAFSPAAIPADNATTSTLTITLPDSGTAPGSTLVQPFVVTMPPGVTISPAQDTGHCGITTVTASQITIGPGSSIPSGGCSIVVTVTASAAGNHALWTPWLQTGGNFAPTVAPFAATNAATGVAAVFSPATVTAGGTTTLTLTLPNAGNATTLAGNFVTTMPGSLVIATQPAPATTCAAPPTVTATTITLPAGTPLANGGCTITVPVVASSTSGALSSLTPTGATVPSPYTGKSLPVYSFTMTTVGSGNLYLSYNAPLTVPTSPTVRTPTRFQSVEFSYSAAIASNGDLTSIDFFGIPLELSTHDPSDKERALAKDRVTYYTSTPTLLGAMLAANPELQCAILRTDGAPFDPNNPMTNFARIVGPNQVAAGGTPPVTNCPATAPSGWTGGTWPPVPPAGSPWPYPSFASYLDSLAAAPAYTFTEADTNIISSYTFDYAGTVLKMGPVTVSATTSALTTAAGTAPAASSPLTVIPGTTTGASAPTMTFVPATIGAGGSSTLTISLPNATGAAYTLAAPFYDVMPPGAIITSIPAGGTCTGVALSPATAPVQIALGAGTSIPTGGCTIVVTVTSARVGTYTNTTSMLQPTGAAAMPLAAAPLTVLAATTSQLSSSIVPGTIAPGGSATWRISFGHTGSAATTLTAPFAATLPAGVTTTSGNSGSCTGATVSATQVGLPSGTTIPAGGCTIVATITSSAQGGVNGTLPSCLDPKLAADGWLIRMTGTTTASGLPSNADLCIPLARHDVGYGSADFVVYGAAQNCETLGLASNGVLQPCSDMNAAALGAVTNSVYGWMQADVLSALNFGYMNGAADATFGSGQSAGLVRRAAGAVPVRPGTYQPAGRLLQRLGRDDVQPLRCVRLRVLGSQWPAFARHRVPDRRRHAARLDPARHAAGRADGHDEPAGRLRGRADGHLHARAVVALGRECRPLHRHVVAAVCDAVGEGVAGVRHGDLQPRRPHARYAVHGHRARGRHESGAPVESEDPVVRGPGVRDDAGSDAGPRRRQRVLPVRLQLECARVHGDRRVAADADDGRPDRHAVGRHVHDSETDADLRWPDRRPAPR